MREESITEKEAERDWLVKIGWFFFVFYEWEAYMEKRHETREVQYNLAVKLLALMANNGFLLPEECEKIDALNREAFSPELSKVYV